ncbi:CD44 antigen isoform X1 [Acomys russatus]|uniref:CD44 antigen isoform X1 n=1 Tax=Acomys russatus TaxID=60746 RepID=UPI0021E2FBB1|nr:CD44 antigen isoform X1 [Acomys russatus]
MDKFWWQAAWGLCLLQLSLAQPQIDLNITCRYAGVYHVEKNGRYSISRTEAADLCKAFNSTLPTMAQMELALNKGFETCRYGFIEGHVVIPRINPNAICAANHTGVYVLTSSNTSRYDTYCFNASAPIGEDCTSVTDIPNSFDGPVTITIVNRDGTRYSKKGVEYRTHQEDIDASNTMDEDVSSGSSSEKSTSDSYILHTYLPTGYPTGDQDDDFFMGSTQPTIASTVHSNSHAATQKQSNWMWFWFGNSQSTTQTQEPTTTATTALMPKRQEAQNWFSWFFQPPESKSHLHTTTKMPGMDSNTNQAGWEPKEENEDETDKYPSFSGSGTDDDEDFISSTIASTSRVSDHTKQNQNWTQWKPIHSNPEVRLQTTTTMTDINRNSTIAHGENWTRDPQPPFNHHEYEDEEESPHATSTTSAHNSHPSQRMTTQSQEDASWTEFSDPISHPMRQGHQTERKDTDFSHSTTLQPTAAPDSHLVEDLNRTGPLSVTTPQSHSQNFSTSNGELEEDKDHPTTPILPSSTRRGGKDGRRGESLPKGATTSLEGYTTHYPDTMENGTLIPMTPTKTGVFGETEVTVAADSDFNADGSLSGNLAICHLVCFSGETIYIFSYCRDYFLSRL